jgi:hypothetical protein
VFSSFAVQKSFSSSMEVSWASLHPQQKRLVYGGSADFWDHVLDYATGAEVETHKGHHGPVHCVRYAVCSPFFFNMYFILTVWQICARWRDLCQRLRRWHHPFDTARGKDVRSACALESHLASEPSFHGFLCTRVARIEA